MDTRKMASEYRLAEWGRLLGERREQGQSIKDFCESVGISRNTYFYWQRKLRMAATSLQEHPSGAAAAIVPRGWIRMEAAVDSMATSIAVEVNGCQINVTAATDPELLRQVCRMLKTL
jgi:Transposase.